MNELIMVLIGIYLVIGACFSMAIYMFTKINGMPFDWRDWGRILMWTPGWLPILVIAGLGIVAIMLIPMSIQNRFQFGIGKRFC